jgi:RND superfamily putative drug exporter
MMKGKPAMEPVFNALGKFAVRYRFIVVAAWIAIAAVCIIALPSLASVTPATTTTSLLPANALSAQAAQLAAPFENTRFAVAILVATRSDGPLTTVDQTAIGRLEARVSGLPHVHSVRDLAVSPDGAARQAVIQADVPQDGSGSAPALVASIRHQFGAVDAPASLTFHLTGPIASTVDGIHALQASQNATEQFTYLVILVLLVVGFRAVLAPVLTLIPAALALALAGPVIAVAATRLGVRVSETTPFVLIVLILGAGTDYGLFLTARVREELRRGLAPREAVVNAMRSVGETITFSALTVIAALCTLAVAQFGVYQSLGPALAIGIALMLLAGLTLLPALLAIFGRAAFWPSSTAPNAARAGGVTAGLWARLTWGLLRRPAITLVAGLGVFTALALGLLGSQLASPLSATTGPAGADSTVGAKALVAHYPGSAQTPTLILFRFPQSVWVNPAPLAQAQQGLGGISALRTVIGPLDPNGVPLTTTQLTQLHAQLGPADALPPTPPIGPSGVTISAQLYDAYRATAQYISVDGRTVQFVATPSAPALTPAAQALVPHLRMEVTQVAAAAGAGQSGVYSQDAIGYDISQVSQHDLTRILPLVVGLIALLLVLVLRSLVAPLYLVVSVLLSYVAALGAVGFLFIHFIHTASVGGAGISFILPFALLVFLMALGSDYNILIMTRIREEAATKHIRVAVRDAVAATGGTITTAGVILAGTFVVLALASAGADNRQFGFGIAIGILLDTFLVRTLLIPALVVLLGRWNWWPGRLFQLSRQAPEVPEVPDAPDVGRTLHPVQSGK